MTTNQALKLWQTAIVSVFVLVCQFGYAQTKKQKVDTSLSSTTTIIDLSNRKEKLVKLDQDFDFYYKQLFTTNASGLLKTNKKLKITDGWDKAIKATNSNENVNIGYGTYHARVVVPENFKSNLSLFVPSLKTSYRLYINGSLWLREGNVATAKEQSVPVYRTRMSEPLLVSDTIDFVLQISNYEHARAGGSDYFLIGNHVDILNHHNTAVLKSGILGGCLIMASIFFICLYLFRKGDTVGLYFAFFTLLFAFRVFSSGFYTIPFAFPWLGFVMAEKLDYITLPLPAIAYALYLRKLFPSEAKSIVLKSIIAIETVFAVIIVFTPLIIHSKLLLPIICSLLLSLASSLYVFYRAWGRREPGAGLGSISFLFFALLVVIAILQQFNINLSNDYVEFLCFLGFFVFQSAVLIQRFAYQIKAANADTERNLELKTTFVRTMSHEIRTPLNGLIGITQLLQQDKSTLTQQQQEYIDTLHFSSNNLLNIVNDILDYEKLDAKKYVFEKEPIELQQVMQHAFNTFKKTAEQKGLEYNFVYDGWIPPLLSGDSTRLVQVIHNLISNALKFTKKGTVALHVSLKQTDGKTAEVLFEVMDTGMGIDKQFLKRLKEPFAQADSSINRNYGGTGLGLAISSKIINQMRSSLQANSTLGQGSTFSFLVAFDIIKRAEMIEATTTTSGPITFKGKKVLLVEDNKVNVIVAKKFLEKWEMNVEVAENGKEAVDKCEVASYDLILMDLQMPVMDGYEASVKILDKNEKANIVALTANLDEQVERQLVQIGIKHFVSKPFKQTELNAKLTEVLGDT
jgi:two-component system, sensor histidine kinase